MLCRRRWHSTAHAFASQSCDVSMLAMYCIDESIRDSMSSMYFLADTTRRVSFFYPTKPTPTPNTVIVLCRIRQFWPPNQPPRMYVCNTSTIAHFLARLDVDLGRACYMFMDYAVYLLHVRRGRNLAVVDTDSKLHQRIAPFRQQQQQQQ